MTELGSPEEIILEMDRLASEDHIHIATQKEIDVYRGNWWIRSNLVSFDTMPTRKHSPQESERQDAILKFVAKFLFMVAMANYLVGSPL